MSLQDLLLVVFCLVDDHLKALGPGSPRQRGPDPELADSEVVTIELVGEYLGLDRDARLFWHFRQHHAAFPARPLHRGGADHDVVWRLRDFAVGVGSASAHAMTLYDPL